MADHSGSVRVIGEPLRSPAALGRVPLVGIIMCTYNGEQFLQSQLNSIAKQNYQHWRLYVSDDGSTDSTLSILNAFSEQYPSGRVTIFNGPQQGFAKNFLSMLARKDVEGDFIAFADQDDVWLENKLEETLKGLQIYSVNVPAVHCSRTQYIDECDCVLGESTLFTKPPSFANALVQSIGGGNTMTINESALEILRPLASQVTVVSHDWWIYLVVSALSGHVIYEPNSLVLYRQHSQNLMGMNTSVSQKWRRIQMLWAGDYRRWNDVNIAALKPLSSKMSHSISRCLNCFVSARQEGLWLRLVLLKKSGVYRQTLLGNLGLLFAVVFNKI